MAYLYEKWICERLGQYQAHTICSWYILKSQECTLKTMNEPVYNDVFLNDSTVNIVWNPLKTSKCISVNQFNPNQTKYRGRLQDLRAAKIESIGIYVC